MRQLVEEALLLSALFLLYFGLREKFFGTLDCNFDNMLCIIFFVRSLKFSADMFTSIILTRLYGQIVLFFV